MYRVATFLMQVPMSSCMHSTSHYVRMYYITAQSLHAYYRSIVLAIIQSSQWREALRHTDGEMTPFTRMIQQMPCELSNEICEALDCVKLAWWKLIFTKHMHSLPSTFHHVSRTMWLAVAFTVLEYVMCTPKICTHASCMEVEKCSHSQ